MPRVLINTIPFGDKNSLSLDMLKAAGIEYVINPLGRKFKEDELADYIEDFDAVIAGTEPLSEKVLSRAKRLKIISRVGVGLDSVDLSAAQKRNIRVSYTPDAPMPAVAEFTIAMMHILLRNIHVCNSQMHKGNWSRYVGRQFSEVTIGIIGVGPIGTRVVEKLVSFGCPRILINDVSPKLEITDDPKIERTDKETIYKEADLISLHTPLTSQTKGMIGYKELKEMKKDAMLINASRGGIIDEADLEKVLNEGHLSSVALDVYSEEPYNGGLCDIERCLLTPHMASMSVECRTKMEIESVEEVLRFFSGKPLKNPVPHIKTNSN